MGNRSAAVLLLAVLAGGQACFAAQGSASGGAYSLDMGYGPYLLFPTSFGTPVFSAGDQLWVMSHYDSTIEVRVAPTGALPSQNVSQAVLKPVPPGVPVMISTFNATDLQGIWLIQDLNSTGTPLPFLLSDAGAEPIDLTLAGSGLKGGAVVMNFTTTPTAPFYDARACVLGASASPIAYVDVPGGEGTGRVGFSLGADGIQVVGSGLGGSNFSLSLELYYSYAFLLPESNSTLVSRSVLTGSSDSVLVSGRGEPPVLRLEHDTPLKEGTYQLRAFFQGPVGLALATTDVLVTDQASWIWTGGCEGTPVYSDSFSLAAPLTGDPSTWPRTVLLIYSAYGEQGFAEVPLGTGFSSMAIVGEPWGTVLSDYQLAVVSSFGVSQYSVANGTMYLMLDGASAYLNYTAGLGSRVFYGGSAGPISPFTVNTSPLNVSKLTVTYVVGGTPFEGGVVGLTDAGGTFYSSRTGAGGEAAFYLPAGAYNITASGGDGSASRVVSLGRGESLSVTLGTGGSGFGGAALALVLAAAAAAGAVANLLVVFRRRGTRRGVRETR